MKISSSLKSLRGFCTAADACVKTSLYDLHLEKGGKVADSLSNNNAISSLNKLSR